MKKELIVSIAAAGLAAAPAAFGQAPSAAPATSDAIATLQKVCLPVLRGGAVKPAARAAGFRLQDGGWVLPIAGKGEIALSPPDASNPHVCTLTITPPSGAPGSGAAMRNALASWATSQSPPLKAVAVDQSVPGAARSWVTSTWSGATPAGAESVVLTQPQPPPSQPAAEPTSAAPPPSTLLVSLAPA